ncbi:PGN_0703 family putative restriction endonuclease [Falsiroseomonas sp. HW251]|uniref:PGN_0703 family putative restriction endonuclease n=1 Tax=Falsiroseomonas sp. HW251 TaxID=3390998 RepID=UPI003D324195
MRGFITDERIAQTAFFAEQLPPGAVGYSGSGYRLFPEHRELNLAPSIRREAAAYFAARGITWHRHANHALSSQVSCLNFLMPLATRPKILAKVIGDALGLAAPTMLEVEHGPDGTPWFVAFEWIGREDYLNEAGRSGVRTRGANATSADAVVRFRHAGRVETVLIEWKYTESYGAPIPPSGNEVRVSRYKNIAFAPAGPIRADCGLAVHDFFWEPFYQFMRQQMLAFRMQAAREDGAERVRVLHISPSANRALHKVTAHALRGYGDDAFKVFRTVLVNPDDFVDRSTEAVFQAVLSEASGEDRSWADYLLNRYWFLKPS